MTAPQPSRRPVEPSRPAAARADLAAESARLRLALEEVSKRIVGQDMMVERLLIGMLTGGHILLEGVPGLAKTLAVRTLAEIIHASFSRIQFTPDLLPADVIGTMIYDQKAQDFYVKKGPLFAQIVLADEINRAPAKVQAALLEAMQERQVTIGGTSFKLEEPFLVLATQNPIENEGTYPLPEAQLDRFMLKVQVGYPEPRRGARGADAHGHGSRHPGDAHPRAGGDPQVPRRRSPTCTWTRSWSTTSSTWCAPRASPGRWGCRTSSRSSPSAPRPAPRWPWRRRRGPTRSFAGARTSSRRTSAPSRPTCCGTAWC